MNQAEEISRKEYLVMLVQIAAGLLAGGQSYVHLKAKEILNDLLHEAGFEPK